MTKETPIPGNTPGLPELNRRALLMGLASASTLAAGAATAGAADNSANLQSNAAPENPDLVRLGEELLAVDAEQRAAAEAEKTIYREAMRIWPRAPDEIVTYGGTGSDLERDIRGAGMGQLKQGRYIGSPERFREMQAFYQEAIDNPKPAKWREKAKPAWRRYIVENERAEVLSKEYFAECERIRCEFGHKAARERLRLAEDALKDHVIKIMNEPEESMFGVLIKAQALHAWGQVDGWRRAFTPEAPEWSAQLAQAMLRQAGATA